MKVALSYEELITEIKDRYDYGEQRVVGIMLARYDVDSIQTIVDSCYRYWHRNSRQFFDIFWAGYGEYLSESEESPTRLILNFPGNNSSIYFDLDAFVSVKDKLNDYLPRRYEDTLQLILLNYRDGNLHFDEIYCIDLETDGNQAHIRRIVETITNEAQAQQRVEPIRRVLFLNELRRQFRQVSIVDLLGWIRDILPI